MTDDPFWVRLVSDDRLLDIAEQFVGPDIVLFASHYIAKRPYDGQAVLWHQDGAYWPLEPMEVVTLWLAFDDFTPENGCLPDFVEDGGGWRSPNITGADSVVDLTINLAIGRAIICYLSE